MLVLKFEVPDEFIDRKEIRTELRKQFRGVGETWHGQHRKRHFSLFGAGIYGYKPRKRTYNRRKRKRRGHTLPLVDSGDTRRLSGTKRVRVRNAGSADQPVFSVVITMPTPPYMNFRAKGSTINKQEELRTLVQSELDQYSAQVVRGVEARISRLRPRRKRKIN